MKIPFFAAVDLLLASFVPFAEGQTFTNLHSFSALANQTTDGANPVASLILSGGTLYGTTEFGGQWGYGTVFAINTNGSGFTILYTFTAPDPTYRTNVDGGRPQGGLVLSGNTLYGTAEVGGRAGDGTVFSLNTNGMNFETVYSFTNGTDGADPVAGLVLSGDTLYGTTAGGGSAGYGTVFAVTTNGSVFTNLYSFVGLFDGAYPGAGLALSGSTLYGATEEGGGGSSGTLFSIHTDGSAYTNFYAFTGGNDGNGPAAAVMVTNNTLYGTAQYGGRADGGTVFSVNTNGVNFETIYSFTNGTDGANPQGNLILLGNTLCGTTYGAYGGLGSNGTVFSVETNSANFETVYSFTNGTDGANPQAGLAGDRLYGTTYNGAINGVGTVFAVNLDGSNFTTLHAFAPYNSGPQVNSDGAFPLGGLVLSGDTLFGTAEFGGASGYGTVFSINTNGSNFATLYPFTGGNDGANPAAGLILDGSTLYGTAEYGGDLGVGNVFGGGGVGTVFSLNTNGSGFTVLYTFTNGLDGANPVAGLILWSNTLYGTAQYGGGAGFGTVFSLNTSGAGFTPLYTFTNGTDGANPTTGLVVLSNTWLIGTASSGGISSNGTLFAIKPDPANAEYSFTGSLDGASPSGNLLTVGPNTVLVTTSVGGALGGGTVDLFEYTGVGFVFMDSSSLNSSVNGYYPIGLCQVGGSAVLTCTDGGLYGGGTISTVSDDAKTVTTIVNFPTPGAPSGPVVGDTAYWPFYEGGDNGTGAIGVGSVAPPCPTIAIDLLQNGQTTFNGLVGASFDAVPGVSDGARSYTVTFVNLPPGLHKYPNPDGTTGLRGSFTESGTFYLTINVIDSYNCPGSEIVEFKITDPPSFSLSDLSQANNILAMNKLDPISTYTGELHDLLPPDIAIDGPMPLVFQRYYAAFLKKDGLIAGTLGDNWLHNFEMKLTVTSSNTVNVVNNLGRFIQFTNSGGVFALINRPDVPFQLSTNGSNFVLGDPRSQMLYTFDGGGELITVADGHGNAQTLSYSGSQLANVTDDLGRTLTFQYSGAGFLTNVSDGTRSVGFAQTGNNLTSVSDALGFVTAYTYDSNNPTPGLMSAATEPQGNIPYSQVFNATGQVISQTEAGANTTTLSYSNLTTTVTNPLGNVWSDAHTELGELASFTDENGETIFTGSDAQGRRNLVLDRLGNGTTLGYHAPSGKPEAITNAEGAVTLFSYAPRPNSGIMLYDLSQAIYPDGTMESFTYDASGNVLTHTDRAGQIFSFSYNNRGQILTAINPLGGVITSTYDAAGRVATQIDTDTGLTTFQYDSLSRLTNVIHPDNTTIQSTFDANDRLLTLKDERGNTTGFAYDQNNRLISTTDANLQVTHFAYDSRDRLVQATDRLGHTLGFSYDTLDHVATVTNRNGNVTIFTYDSRRRLASLADPGGKIWSFGYDNEAIPTSSANPLGQTDSQAVNPLGYPVTFINALGQMSSVARDSMQRTTNAVDEINRTNSFGYEARGLLANTTSPLIGTATYQHNNLGLLSGITGLNGEQWDFAYTPMGRLQALADPLNRMSLYSYDDRGRLQQTVFADGVVRTNSYDQASNPTGKQYSGGPALQFTYDSLNRLASANDLSFAYDAEGRLTNTVSSGVNQGAACDADGRLTSVTYQNGAFTVNYTYDSRDRLTQVSDTLTRTQISFNYDDAGRLTSITRPNGVNGAYTYDAAARLTRIQEGATIDIQYGYDAAGEVTNANFTAPLDPASLLAPALSAFTYDAAHQIKNSGYAFDARGRQTASPDHSYQWDGASRLVGIDGVAMAYNGANDIETRADGGVTTRYFYNHALGLTPITAERDESTLQVQRYYVWTPGGRLLYMIDAANGNAVYYFHFDRVGSTLALTSGAGVVTDAYAYSPYGVLLGHTGTSVQPFTYIGEFGVRSEAAANLYHMRARYYNPVSARFLTRDALWPRLADNRSLDPYAYANENPLRFIDPAGAAGTWHYTYERGRITGFTREDESQEYYRENTLGPDHPLLAYLFYQDHGQSVPPLPAGFNPMPPTDTPPGIGESQVRTYTGDEGATEVSPPLHVAGAAQITDGHQLTVVALASTTSTFNPGLLVNQTFPDLSPPHLDGIPIPNTWSADELHVPLGIFSGSAVGEKRPIVNIDPFFSFYNFLSPSVGVDGMDKANPGLFTVGVNARGYIYFGQ